MVDKTILNIFGSKDNLVFSTMSCIADIATEQIEKCISSQEYSCLNGAQQVMRILEELARILKEKPQIIFLLNQAESLVATKSIDSHLTQTYLRNRDYLTACVDNAIDKGIKDGSIRKDIDKEQAHVALITAFRGILQDLVHVN